MRIENPKPPAWLKEDRVWKWKSGRWQIRCEQWFARLSIIPSIWFDWETGMVSVGFTVLAWCLIFDYEFDPEYESSEYETEYPV
jgi:hypothetical protein